MAARQPWRGSQTNGLNRCGTCRRTRPNGTGML